VIAEARQTVAAYNHRQQRHDAGARHLRRDPPLDLRDTFTQRRSGYGRSAIRVVDRNLNRFEGRGDEEVTVTGTIRTLRLDKGFGFIKDDAGKEYFFHRSAVYGEGLENLREGDSVEFDVGQGPKGPRAENVRRTST
jgi:CspA family cold shock protein